MAITYTPGSVVTVADLVVGDSIFLQQREPTIGLPEPTHPATVVAVEPTGRGTHRLSVLPPLAGAAVPPRFLGDLPAAREFRRAVVVAAPETTPSP